MALFFPASGFMGLSGRKDRAKPYRFGRSATNEGTEAVGGFSQELVQLVTAPLWVSVFGVQGMPLTSHRDRLSFSENGATV